MAAQNQAADNEYRCPDCSGNVAFEHQSWQCVDCGYVPKHAAD